MPTANGVKEETGTAAEVQSVAPVSGGTVYQRKPCACGCGGLATKWAIRGHHWRATAMQRFLAKISVGDGCWEWQGGGTGNGYGYHFGTVAHRFAYERLIGPIPPGLDLDHLCRNRSCVRPDHLEPVTRQENLLRGVGFPAINSRKKECPRGHIYSEANTWIARNGGRYCRECNRLRHQPRSAALGRRGG